MFIFGSSGLTSSWLCSRNLSSYFQLILISIESECVQPAIFNIILLITSPISIFLFLLLTFISTSSMNLLSLILVLTFHCFFICYSIVTGLTKRISSSLMNFFSLFYLCSLSSCNFLIWLLQTYHPMLWMFFQGTDPHLLSEISRTGR